MPASALLKAFSTSVDELRYVRYRPALENR